MEEKLNSVLQRVLRLCKENQEFDIALRKALKIESSASLSANDGTKLKRIEQYLGLDYAVDNQNSLIDYSFVIDNEVRKMLECDNREMMRYRYGTRYHKEDFSEFCRYAHLQIEMLLNHYYLLKGGGNIEEVKDYIKQYNKDINYDKITTVYSIHFNVKWYAFRIEHKPSIPYAQDRVVEHIREMRNELSHRSPGVENFDMVAFKRANLDGKFPLNEAGEVAWNKCDGNQQEELRKKQNNYAYKRYQFSIWAKRQPTHEVLNSIQLVADMVRTNSQR